MWREISKWKVPSTNEVDQTKGQKKTCNVFSESFFKILSDINKSKVFVHWRLHCSPLSGSHSTGPISKKSSSHSSFRQKHANRLHVENLKVTLLHSKQCYKSQRDLRLNRWSLPSILVKTVWQNSLSKIKCMLVHRLPFLIHEVSLNSWNEDELT